MNNDTKKIKIVFIIGSLQLGGAERQLAELAVRLDKERFEVEICCIAQGGPLLEYVREHGVPVRIFDFFLKKGKYNPVSHIHIIRELWKIFHYIRTSDADIVHAFLYTAYIVGIPCARLSGVPLTLASRRSLGYFKDTSYLKQPLENLVNRLTHVVLVNSKAVKADVLAREKIDPEKIRLIYNGVDIGMFQEMEVDTLNLKQELGIPEDSIIIGVVANLIHYKGHRGIIEAARIIKPQEPRAKFVLVGRDGGIKNELDVMIDMYELGDTIFFTGDRTDVPRLMHLFDIAALTSHEEGFSNVILEAMASGTPLVATAVGGNPEAVVNEETGLLVPPRSPEELADALLRLLKNPEMRNHMGTKGLERVREYFSMERLIENMESLYLELLEKQQSGIQKKHE